MPKEKKKKTQECYQLVDFSDAPVRIVSSWQSSHILPTKAGKIFKNRGACITSIKNHIKHSQKFNSTDYKFFIKSVRVSKDEWCNYLLSLKIQIFQPISTIDLAFFLDRIKESTK